ncbi:hypothetical protein Q73_07820 [Bacillus coahuilensis m2-6]|uniref:DMT family transporter n=1 Tax=Bacillus coahuilensis TaxID=408580 RepID=UPI00075032A2|nr:DMT family transporter [Bacillus coahuilensis]KUP08001.1 hypothetical protein Q73_07820 [Bacillus coahuilensis m2-6]
MKQRSIIADILLLCVSFIWGTTFVLVQNAVDTFPPFSFLTIRFLIASILLYFVIQLLPTKKLYLTKSLLLHGCIIGTAIFIGFSFQTFGLLYTSSSKAGFITGLNVIIVPFLAFFLSKKGVSLKTCIGAILSLMGLFFLSGLTEASVNLGDILVLICAFGFAFQIFYTDKFASMHDVLNLTLIQLFTVLVLSFLGVLFFESPSLLVEWKVYQQPSVILALIITGILATAVAFFVQTWAQTFTTPTRVAIIFAMEPVFAAFTGILFAREVLTWSQLIGCLFILFGMLVVELKLNMISINTS